MKKQFRLYDVMEGKELLGEFDNGQQVAKACREWAIETDDECQFMLYKFNEDDNKYHIVKDWVYNNRTITIINQ